MSKLLVILFILGLVLFFAFIFWQSQQTHAPQKGPATSPKPGRHASKTMQTRPPELDAIAEQEVELAYNQVLFDQVAELLFESKTVIADRQVAEQIQQRYLAKMPAQVLSQVGEFELGEWSVFWTFRQQSLEYYVARYGVFYTHVDRFGREHSVQHALDHFQS